MHQPKKWWIGLPILIAIVYFAGDNLTPLVEADIQAHAMTRLAGAAGSSETPKISVAGRDLTVLGLAPEAKARALAELRMVPGPRKFLEGKAAEPQVQTAALAKPAEIDPPRAAPYTFAVALGDSVITLSGQLPSEAMRKDVVTKVAALRASAAVSDGTRIEANAPKGDFAGAIDFALASLNKLSQGRAVIVDGRISIAGQGKENIHAAAIEADAKARLPQGFELAKADIAAGPMSPYILVAAREGGQVIMTGYAPDESTRKRLVEAARKRFFDATIDDRLVVAKGAPSSFADAVDNSLSALARLADGRLSISGADVTLTGNARYQSARAEIERTLTDSLPSSFRSDTQIRSRSDTPFLAEPCRAALKELSSKPIAFSSDDLSVEAESAPLIDAIVATAMRCQNVAIEISAYTDNLGIEELNRARANRRANAVLERLVKAGVEPMKLSAVGYGAERPIAPNDTEENRARNRRVEFTVK